MSAVAFDTLKLARKLRDTAHMTQEQSEGIADAMAEAMSGAELATKSDLVAVKSDLAAVKSELQNDIAAVKSELKSNIRETELRLEAKIEVAKSEMLRAMLAAIALNSAVVLGGMFGLAKLLGH